MVGDLTNRRKSRGRSRLNRHLTTAILACLSASAVAATAVAQDQARAPAIIRVRSDEVLVPVLVLDKSKVEAIEREDMHVFNWDTPRSFYQNLAVKGLVSTDFQVFDDGQQQTIERVTFGPNDERIIRDPLGVYDEWLGMGEGIWVWVPPATAYLANLWPAYLLAYVPAHASAGPCHELSVTVNRADSLVYALKGYCADRGSIPYPLRATLTHGMNAQLSSKNKGTIPISLSAVPLLSETGNVPVQVSLDFPEQSLSISPKDCVRADSFRDSMHLLGTLRTKSGGLAAQFGDLDVPWSNFLGVAAPIVLPDAVVSNTHPGGDPSFGGCFVDSIGYQRQIYLPPGQYDLQVVFAVGEKRFGRSEIPVTVESQDDQHLALSGIALAKRIAPAPTRDDALTGTYVTLVSHGVEYTPAANLNFKKTDPFYFYLEVRNPRLYQRPDPAIQVNLRIVDAKSGAVVRNLDPLNAAEFAIPGNPIIPIGSGIHIDDLPPGQYRLQAQAVQLPSTAPASLNSPPPAPPQTTPWHSVPFTIQ
jgi:hypothetical protein